MRVPKPHRNLRRLAALLFSSAVCLLPAAAQDTVAPEPLRLTPTSAAELAVRQAAEVELAQEAVTQAEVQVRQAATGRGLQGNVSVVEGRTGPIPSFEIEGQQVQMGDPIVRRADLSLTQPLYTGTRVERAMEVAQAGVRAAEEQVTITRRALYLRAQEAAFAVLRAQELAEVARRRVQSAREHLRVSRAAFEAGTAPQFEVVQAQTELSRAEGDLIAAETGVQQALAGVRRLLNLPQTQLLEIASPDDPLPTPEGVLPEWIEAAWSQRPEVRSAQARVQQAETAIRLARAGTYPTVALFGQFSHQRAASVFATELSWQVALSLNKPLFDGGKTRVAVEEAQARLRSAELALEVQRQDLALEVIREQLALDQATKQLQVATQGVVEAQERRRIAGVRFEAGVSTGLEVIDAQTALAAAEAAQVNANYDVQLALIRLYYALGQPLGGETQ